MSRTLRTRNTVVLNVNVASSSKLWQPDNIPPVQIWDLGNTPNRGRLAGGFRNTIRAEFGSLLGMVIYDSQDREEAEIIARANEFRKYIGHPMSIDSYNLYSREADRNGIILGGTVPINDNPVLVFLKDVKVIDAPQFNTLLQTWLNHNAPETPLRTDGGDSVYDIDNDERISPSPKVILLELTTDAELTVDWDADSIFRVFQMYFLTNPGATYVYDGVSKEQARYDNIGFPRIRVLGGPKDLTLSFIATEISQVDAIILSDNTIIAPSVETIRGLLSINATTDLGIGGVVTFNDQLYKLTRWRIVGKNSLDISITRNIT